MDGVLNTINAFAWVGSNLLVLYIAIALIVFVTGYYILFDPRSTTGGKLIFRFMFSLIGVIALVFVGTFVDPANQRHWTVYPGDVAPWRPVVRLIIYGYVAYTITSLAILLGVRKWHPERVAKASDLNLVRLRHTGEINTASDPQSEK